jgi:hypothetical protein
LDIRFKIAQLFLDLVILRLFVDCIDDDKMLGLVMCRGKLDFIVMNHCLKVNAIFRVGSGIFRLAL